MKKNILFLFTLSPLFIVYNVWSMKNPNLNDQLNELIEVCKINNEQSKITNQLLLMHLEQNRLLTQHHNHVMVEHTTMDEELRQYCIKKEDKIESDIMNLYKKYNVNVEFPLTKEKLCKK